jgi:hypothetical protein
VALGGLMVTAWSNGQLLITCAEELVERQRAVKTTALTPDEWHRYLPGQTYQRFREDLP